MKNTTLTLAIYLENRGPVKSLTRIEAETFGVPYPLPKGWARAFASTDITSAMLDQLRKKIERAKPSTAEKARRGLDGAAKIGAADAGRGDCASYTPALACSAPATPVAMPALYPREVYAGVGVGADLVARHLILLPGDVHVGCIEDAVEFVASGGGELPTYAELAHLHKNMGFLFKPSLYYSCEQEPYDGDMATMLFDFAHQIDPDQRDTPRQVRVRAVRRVLAEADIGPAGGISEQQVAALASRLIDQNTVGDGEESIERARMVSTGIMVGIRLMATEVQKALVARQHQQAGGRQ